MMAAPPTASERKRMTPTPGKWGRRHALADTGFRWATLLAGALILMTLAAIVLSMVTQSWPVFTSQGIGYLTRTKFDQVRGLFGVRAYLYGTSVVSILAIVLAVPMSVGIALFTTEIAPQRVRVWITTVVDLLASVPSVVFGLWGFLTLRPKLDGIYSTIHRDFHAIPILRTVFGASGGGNSFMTAGLIVALMITPTITSITREAFLTVPRNDKDGALALGATRWEMIRGVVFPHSSGGIVGASMLGLGRAMGETIAIALVIGANPQIVANLFAAGEAMPSVIVRNLPESDGMFRAALVGLGVMLVALTIMVNIGAKVVVSRLERLRGT